MTLTCVLCDSMYGNSTTLSQHMKFYHGLSEMVRDEISTENAQSFTLNSDCSKKVSEITVVHDTSLYVTGVADSMDEHAHPSSNGCKISGLESKASSVNGDEDEGIDDCQEHNEDSPPENANFIDVMFSDMFHNIELPMEDVSLDSSGDGQQLNATE